MLESWFEVNLKSINFLFTLRISANSRRKCDTIICIHIYIYIRMYVCGSQCEFVDEWLKKGFYLQCLWTASDCLEKFLCVNCLWVAFAPKIDKELYPYERSWGSETGSRESKDQGRWFVKSKTRCRRVGSLRVRHSGERRRLKKCLGESEWPRWAVKAMTRDDPTFLVTILDFR